MSWIQYDLTPQSILQYSNVSSSPCLDQATLLGAPVVNPGQESTDKCKTCLQTHQDCIAKSKKINPSVEEYTKCFQLVCNNPDCKGCDFIDCSPDKIDSIIGTQSPSPSPPSQCPPPPPCVCPPPPPVVVCPPIPSFFQKPLNIFLLILLIASIIGFIIIGILFFFRSPRQSIAMISTVPSTPSGWILPE